MKKIRLLYDGTILANGLNKNVGRSGIFFTALNIFSEMIKRKDIELSLYCDIRKYNDLKKYLKEHLKNNEIDFVCNKLDIINAELSKNKIISIASKNYFLLFLFKILSVLFLPFFLINNFIFSVKIQRNYDAFLSPIHFIPNFIKIKKYTLLHDLIPLLFEEYHSMFWKKGEWLYDLCKTLNSKDNYFTNSNCTKNDFLKYFPIIDKNKIHTTYLACADLFKLQTSEKIEQIKEKYSIPKNKKYIFSLCNLAPHKNLIRMAKTFIQFVQKNNIDDLILVIGGSAYATFIKKLENEISNFDIYKNKILKIGYVQDADVPILYSGALWFCYTSQYEGFGLPPLEAMSCGCPVITSNNSSIPEVVGDAGIMVDWNSDEQHIEAYEKYYYNEELRTKNSQKGLERAKQFSWRKCVDEMVKEIKKN